MTHYFCFYVNEKLKKKLVFFQTAVPKIEYVIESLNVAEEKTVVVSACSSNKGLVKCQNYNINERQKALFFSTFGFKNTFLKKINTFICMLQHILYVLFKVKKNDNVLVYHSLYYGFLYPFLKMKKCNIIEEVEEIYVDVLKSINKPKKYILDKEKSEKKIFKYADKYIYVSKLLAKQVNIQKPYVVLMGTYDVSHKKFVKVKDGKTHLLYSGTFVEDKGVNRAIAIAGALDDRFVMHISGFGTKEQVEKVKKSIALQNFGAKIIYHGCLDYAINKELAEKCHIGLCVQDCNATYNNTSFPSKILFYLSCGLTVISPKMRALMESELNEVIIQYDNESPVQIANTIKKIDVSENSNSSSVIERLDKEFKEKIKDLLQIH